MRSKRLFNNYIFTTLSLAVLVVCIISALVNAYLMTRLDTLIHVQLYNFGLQFDHTWAESYYTYAYMMYSALGLTILLSFITIVAGLKIITTKAPEPAQKTASKLTQPQPRLEQTTCRELVESQPKPTNSQETKIAQQQPQFQSQPAGLQELKTKVTESISATSTTCPECKKKFSTPLLMLNFEGGKSKLVKICPYCSFALDGTKKEHQSQGGSQMVDIDEKLTNSN